VGFGKKEINRKNIRTYKISFTMEVENNGSQAKSFFDKFFSERLSLILSVISFCCIIISAIVFCVFGSWNFSQILDESKIGQFGDFIGGVIGTILAFVAAILYYVALREQRKDIAINQQSAKLQNEALIKQIEEFEKQKEELELTRKVYEQQSKTMREQERTMKLQQFESTFYSLLNVCISIKTELNKYSDQHNYFKVKYNELLSLSGKDINQNLSSTECHKIVVTSYIDLFLKHKGELSHYFKSIYRLMKVIDTNQTLNDKERVFYSKILRAQLTEYELLLMNYNYHSTYALKARNIIYKYNMLKHINPLSKIEFVCRYGAVNENSTLIAFFDLMNKVLEQNINLFCDSIDIHEPEEEFKPFECTIKVSNKDIVSVDIICFDKQKLPQNFEHIFYDYLYDKLFISQFRLIDDGIASPHSGKEEHGVLFLSYILNENRIGKINIDK
jgi:hypothetical protein